MSDIGIQFDWYWYIPLVLLMRPGWALLGALFAGGLARRLARPRRLWKTSLAALLGAELFAALPIALSFSRDPRSTQGVSAEGEFYLFLGAVLVVAFTLLGEGLFTSAK